MIKIYLQRKGGKHHDANDVSFRRRCQISLDVLQLFLSVVVESVSCVSNVSSFSIFVSKTLKCHEPNKICRHFPKDDNIEPLKQTLYF